MLKKLAVSVGLLILATFVLFVVNQTAQIVALANTFSFTAGRITLWLLIAFYCVVGLTPVILILRLPKPLRPPADLTSKDFDSYLKRLGERLAANPLLQGKNVDLAGQTSIEAAIKHLDDASCNLIRATASQVFVSTAISQNGRLDALLVLAAQTRMIWSIAHIYNQRPRPADLMGLYSNVAAAVMITSQLEDIELDEQINAVVGSVLGASAVGLIPGLGSATSLVVQSLLDGAANAFLTLRVGAICQLYCGSISGFDRARARRSASLTAAAMLGSIVATCGAIVVKRIAAAATRTGSAAAQSVVCSVKSAGSRLNPFKSSTRSAS